MSHQLTAREREVVPLLAEGKSNKEVAVALNLSVKTAETHRSNLMRKLGLHSVSEPVLYAVRNHIVQIPEPYASEDARPRHTAAGNLSSAVQTPGLD